MITLSDDQIQAVNALRNGNVLNGPVGCGKSIIALTYYYTKVCRGAVPMNGSDRISPMKNPKDLYIVTTARKRDAHEWEAELARFSLKLGRNEFTFVEGLGDTPIKDTNLARGSYTRDAVDIVEHGSTGSKTDAKEVATVTSFSVEVTIISWNQIGKYKDVKDAVFLYDEQRLVGSGAWVKSFYKISKSNQWIILTGTPGDNWLDYIPVFVANGFYRNRTEFLSQHAVFSHYGTFPKLERVFGVGRLQRRRDSIMVQVDYVSKNERVVRRTTVDYDKELLRRVYRDRWNVYDDEPIKNIAGAYFLSRKVVNSDASRCEAISDIRLKHPRVIIFYNFDYELELLRTLCEGRGWLYAEWNGHKHQETPTGDDWVYLVQYTAGSEAWNCTTTDTIIFYSLTYKYKELVQAFGRIDRRNTPYKTLYYYVLKSSSWIDNAIYASNKAKKNFNELTHSKQRNANV